MLNLKTERILNSIDGVVVKDLAGLNEKTLVIKGIFDINKRNFLKYEKLDHIPAVHSVLALDLSLCSLEEDGLYRLIFRAKSELSHSALFTNYYDRSRTMYLEFVKKGSDN